MRARNEDGCLLIRVAHTFDGLTAGKLEKWLASAKPGMRLRLDLTRVRHFHDFAIAVLADAMTRCSAHVTCIGLGAQQVRPLRSFDVDTAALERAVAVSDAAWVPAIEA